LYRPEFLSYVAQAANTYAEQLQVHPVTFAAFRQSPWYHCGILGLEQSQLSVRSPYIDNDFVRTVFRAPKPNSLNHDVRLRLIRDGNPDLGRIRTDRGIGGSSGRLSEAISRSLLDFTLKRNTLATMECPIGWLGSIISSRHSTSSAFSLAGISCCISEFGTGTHFPSMFGKCCSTP
jgi:hypothetical protein